MRIGFGYDVHRLTKGRKLILGGVLIPYEKGLEGHSDADVLLHAVIDSLIGAMAEGDIGRHFPAGDPQFLGISSLKLLDKVKALLDSNGYEIGNIDSTVVLEEPRLAPFMDQIRTTIATALGAAFSQINVKAKTEEGLGFTGEKKGISAYAVSLIRKKP